MLEMRFHSVKPRMAFSKKSNALDRMSELAMLAQDETKTNADRDLYHKEIPKLDDHLSAIKK